MAKELTLAELQQQIKDLQDKANQIIQAEKAGIIEDLKAKILQYGITANDLGFKVPEVKTSKTSGNSEKSTPIPMYRNTTTGETWHGGKGRLPLWLQAILKTIQEKNPEAGNPELKAWLDENGYKIKE